MNKEKLQESIKTQVRENIKTHMGGQCLNEAVKPNLKQSKKESFKLNEFSLYRKGSSVVMFGNDNGTFFIQRFENGREVQHDRMKENEVYQAIGFLKKEGYKFEGRPNVVLNVLADIGLFFVPLGGIAYLAHEKPLTFASLFGSNPLERGLGDALKFLEW